MQLKWIILKIPANIIGFIRNTIILITKNQLIRKIIHISTYLGNRSKLIYLRKNCFTAIKVFCIYPGFGFSQMPKIQEGERI